MNQNRRLCLTRRIASGVAACSLGVFLAAGTPVQALAASPQFAYSTEKWASLQDDKLEFDEIADLIHEYNSTVEKNRIEYKDYQGKNSNEIAQEYYDAAGEIESSIEYPDSDDANYGSSLAAAQRSEASATQMREQGDNNVDDANVKAWGYTQTEKSLVQQAQNLMLQYWNAQENLKSVQNQVSKAEKDYETANLKLSSGSATQTDVLDAKETLLKAQASITMAESNIASTKESLCQMLGWKYGASVEICALPDPQEQMSASINLEEDIAKAQENNYQLKILARQVNNAMTSTLKERYQTTLTSGKEAVKSNVQSAYQNLKLSEAQYEQAKRSLELEEKTKQTNDRKLAAGLCTETDLLQAQKNLLSAQTALQSTTDQANKALRQLAILLGKSGTSITLGEIPAVSATELASMNLDADRAAAVVASSSVKSARRSSATGDAARKLRHQQIEEAESAASASADEQYAEIAALSLERDAAQAAYQSAEKTYGATQIKYQSGAINKSTYLQGEASYLQKKAELETAEISLRTAYDAYEWMLKGVA